MRHNPGMPLRAAFVLLLAVVVLGYCSRPARAAGSCAEANHAWTARCTRVGGLRFQHLQCPPGRVVVRVESGGGPPLDVEIAPSGPHAFRSVAGFGLSPIGEFPDWKRAPPAQRRALDQLGDCLRRTGGPTLGVQPPESEPTQSGQAAPSPGAPTRTPPLPWLLFAALALLAVVIAMEIRRAQARRRRWLTLLALGVPALACLALRRALLPFAYFHQNGQGPLWIMDALSDTHGVWRYGPGYSELFGTAARALAAPAHGVFILQALLGAAAVPAAWIIARRVGAGPLLAAALAALVLFDPVLARAAQSESYFAACTSLLFLAGAALAEGSWHARARSLRFNLAVASAGLFIALAATIHPICWVAAAFVPAIVLVERGALRRRALLALHAALGIATVVAVAAGPAMLGVVRGSLGRQWMPAARSTVRLDVTYRGGIVILLAAVVVLALRRRPRWRRAALGIAVAALAGFVLGATNLVHSPAPPWVGYAYGALFAPVLLAATAAALSSVLTARRIQRWLSLGVLALGAMAAAHHRRLATELPTDTREEAWASQWQAALPAGALVAYLQRAGRRVQVLPLYGTGPTHVRGFPLTAGAPVPDLAVLGSHVYYYRSSLCSSREGRAFCRDIQHRSQLRQVAARSLPAVPSLEDLPYDTDPVRVVLYRVEPRQGPEHAP